MQAARLRTLTPMNTARGHEPPGLKPGPNDPRANHHSPPPAALSAPSTLGVWTGGVRYGMFQCRPDTVNNRASIADTILIIYV